jgi:uroporphyrinogen decarboxylase
MTGKERTQRTITRQETDRPASWLGIPDAAALPGLCAFFGQADALGLKRVLDDDIFPVQLPYGAPGAPGAPGAQEIYTALQFAKKPEAGRTLTAPGFFEDAEDPGDADKFPWPRPEDFIAGAACRAAAEAVPPGKAALGVLWSAHFQDACAAFGMEQALVNMHANPELYLAVEERITDFYLRANKIFYEHTQGLLDMVLIGNDLGSQCGLLLSPEMIRRFVLPGARKLIDQAHSYGVRVMYHSCGAVTEIFEDLIALGVDVLHPIQALAAGMAPEGLKRRFGGRVAFCGGVDAQRLLVGGTPEEVAETVRGLKKIFPTGLILSPSHEAILPDTPPENIAALFRAVKEGTE